MPLEFPLTGYPKYLIPTAPNHFLETVVNEIVDYVLFVQLETPESSYPGLIAVNSFVNEFEPETAVQLIDDFHKTKTKRRRVEYFKEVYCRDKILRNFIKLKPTCFLIMGVPCDKYYELGDAFAKKTSRVHVNVLDLMNEEIARGTDVGKWIYTNLKNARYIPIQLIMKLLTRALKRPDVAYRGYVLTSFPLIPFKKFPEHRLPIRFSCLDDLEAPPADQCKEWLRKRSRVIKHPGGDVKDSSSKVNGSNEGLSAETSYSSGRSNDIDNNELFQGEDDGFNAEDTDNESLDSETTEFNSEFESGLHEIIDNNRLSNPLEEAEVVYSVRNQFDTLLKLDLPPDIIVYIRHDEDDRHPCRSPVLPTKPNVDEGAAETVLNKELSDASLSSSASTDTTRAISSSTSSSMSEDYTDDIFEYPPLDFGEEETPLYMKRFISIKNEMEQFILHYSKDMVLKIDSRYSTKEVLEQLDVRTKFINFKCVNEAVPLFPGGISEKLQQKLSTLETIEQKMGCICRIDPVMTTLAWRKGSFMAKCPVKLHQGKMVQGKLLFAVRFLGYIHLLSSFPAMKKFIRDPCKYFLCKPNCRVAIVGPRIPLITTVMKSILDCVDYDWKSHLDRQVCCEDIYKEATEWANEVMENIDVQSVGDYPFPKTRGLSNVLASFRTATEQLLGLLSDDFSTEDDVFTSEALSDIGPDFGDSVLVDILRSMFNNKERLSQMPQALRASLKAVLQRPYDKIFEILVEEKFNENFKARYPHQLAREVSGWIKQQDLEVSIKTNRKQKYAKWLVHDAPTDLSYWKYLARRGTLPDVVIFLKLHTPLRLFNFYSKQKEQLEDVQQIASYIIRNFPVLFHEAECMLKNVQLERFAEPKLFSPLEELLNGIELDVKGNDGASLQELENYLSSQRVITISQDMQQNNPTASDVAVIQKYFEIFKTKAMVQSEEDIQRLTEINADFERQRIIVDRHRSPDYSECFDLNLQQAQLSDVASKDAVEETQMEEVEEIDLAEVSQRNRRNIEVRSQLQHLPYGNTRKYCPVVYSEHNSLLHGLPQYSVEYSNRLYMMSSPRAVEQFLRRPFKYAQDCLELIPPPFRCCIAGPNNVNRHLFAALLASQRKVTTSTILTLLKEYIQNRNLTHKWARTSYEDIYEKHCDDFLASHVSRYFKEGFVLEGFPTTSKEFDDMLRNHLYTEVIVIADGGHADIARNLYRSEKHVWEDKMLWLVNAHRRRQATAGAEMAEEFEADDVLDFGSEHAMNRSETEGDYSSSNERLDTCKWPTDEERERIFTRMQANAHKRVKPHVEGIKSVAKSATEHNIPVVQVPFDLIQKRANLLKLALESISPDELRTTMFDHVFVVSLEVAEKLLATGMCFYSHFKNFDPVDAYHLIPVNMHETMRKRKQLYACLYRRLIYFLNGAENLAAFRNNPKLFAKGDYPISMVLPLRMAILGPPYSGISTLCNRIAKEFNMKVFTKEDLLSTIQSKFPCSNLAGKDPDTIRFSKLFIESMHIVRNCSSNGFILDNHQMDPVDIVNIAKHDAALHLVLVVDSELATVWRNWKAEHVRLRSKIFTNVPYELRNLHRVFWKHKKMSRAFMEDVRDIRLFNTVVVNKTNCKWEQWEEARSQIYISLREIGGYFHNLGSNKCSSLAHMNVFWHEFQKRLSPIKAFCPVCLRLERKLTQFRYEYVPVGLGFYDSKCQQKFNEPFGYNLESLYQQYNFPKWHEWQTERKPLLTDNAFRENLIQFHEHFYWSCDQHRFDLMLHTEEYLPPDCNYLPHHVPFLVTNYFNLDVQHAGKCVVTYYTTRTYVSGSDAYAVFYRGKIYLCASAECALTFLEQPDIFYNCTVHEEQDLEDDCEIRDMTIDYGTLTPDLLVEALTALAKERPKHYGLSVEDSAAIYVGLYLKCVNPNNSLEITKLYQKTMSNYLRDCGLLRSKLAKLQTEGNPYIRRFPVEGSSRHI